jgi:hypothetical protein
VGSKDIENVRYIKIKVDAKGLMRIGEKFTQKNNVSDEIQLFLRIASAPINDISDMAQEKRKKCLTVIQRTSII